MNSSCEELTNKSPTASLYTELPYPADGVVRTTNARILRAGVEKHAPHLLQRERLRIIDVGCGTGENTAALARLFGPKAEIFGADINPASLKLAKALAEREGANIRFVQCDIQQNLPEALEAASPGQCDIVMSIGVLHHLGDPRAGFSAVRRIIKPDGLFLSWVYSDKGRREDIANKELLNEILPPGASLSARGEALQVLGLANRHSLVSGIRSIWRRLKFGPPFIPSEIIRVAMKRNRLTHISDSYSNPCEHLYRFAEFKALLAETGWDFLSLAKHAGLPTTPEEHTRNPAEQALLRAMAPEAMYDYFAFYYQALGFSVFCKPSKG